MVIFVSKPNAVIKTSYLHPCCPKPENLWLIVKLLTTYEHSKVVLTVLQALKYTLRAHKPLTPST